MLLDYLSVRGVARRNGRVKLSSGFGEDAFVVVFVGGEQFERTEE